jgi:formylglycine-generating enzyme required for sulfatase activity
MVLAVEPPESQLVPAGRLAMGCEAGRPDEVPVHRVHVGAFRLGRTPVTVLQYATFLAATGTAPPPAWQDPALRQAAQPIVGVSWDEAVAYATWLSVATGRRFRLPTEAEWERAARGGLEGALTSWGAELPAGEIPSGTLTGPWPVGRGTPNGFGLLDIGTIVHEWCLDWYDSRYYLVSPPRDPRGPETGSRRASRGGSWRHHVRWSRPSARSSLPPGFRYADYGFRVLEEVA